MTYKEIVDRFKDIANQHYMLKDFGYGQLSDIKVHAQEGEADYPYLFLNYTTHNRAGVSMNYNFNMIVMDVATDEDDVHSNFLAIQSKCQQYIDDVIAELYYGYTDKPEINYTNVTYTPFKERFQDSVAGMTATITIQVPTPINQCIAPFPGEPFPGCVPVVDVFSNITQGFDPDSGNEPPIGCVIIALSNGGWREDIPGLGGNFYKPQSISPITWTITGTILMEVVNPGDVINPFVIQKTATSNIIQPTTLTGWPTDNIAPPAGSKFTFEATYRIENPSQGELQLAINPDTPSSQARFALLSGANIQICEDGATPPEPRGTTLVVVANNLDQPFNLNQPGVDALGWVGEDYYINDGNWNGFDYRPQTTDPYRWVLSGQVQFNSPGEIAEFQIYDPVEGTNAPPTSSNWPTNPTIGEVYDFELVWEGITPTVNTFYQSVYVQKPTGTAAEFTILGSSAPTGSVLNIYLED